MIGMTAFGDFSVIANTISTALVPSTSTHFSFKHDMTSTLYDRLQNFILNGIVRLVQEFHVDPAMDRMVRNVVGNKYHVLPLKLLRSRAILALVNHNEIVGEIEQLPDNVIGVGGLQIQPPRQLSMVRRTRLLAFGCVHDIFISQS